MIDKDIEIVKEMFFEDEAFKPTEYVEMFFHRYQQQAIENVLKELETYKKIAKKLAEKLSIAVQSDYVYEKLCSNNVNYVDCGNRRIAYKCKQCILEWTRKEVENEK